MYRKCALFLSFFALLSAPLPARAQSTMDVATLVQNLLDEFSRIRAELEVTLSKLNVEDLSKNLGTDALDAIKGDPSSLFNKEKPEDRGLSKMAPVLPAEIAQVVDDPEASAAALRELLLTPKNRDIEKTLEVERARDDYAAVAKMTAYGNAVFIRKNMDRELEKAEEILEKAKNAESEVELEDLTTQAMYAKLEQSETSQVLKAMKNQYEAAESSRIMSRNQDLKI